MQLTVVRMRMILAPIAVRGRRWFLGGPAVWAGRCAAVVFFIVAQLATSGLLGWEMVADAGVACKDAPKGSLSCMWIGLPPDNRRFAFYAAFAVIVILVGLIIWLRNQIDPRDLRNIRTVGLALLQIVVGIILAGGGDLFGYGPQPPRWLADYMFYVVFWMWVSGFFRFLMLIRNPAKVRR